jgi:two-component system sensor histidine kinase/response regulator
MPELPLARILIVDDEVRQMRALCDTLGQHGYEMTGVSCGEDAIDALRKESLSLL